MTDDLACFRAEIDSLDDRIVDLLARRFAVCRDVARHKRKHGVPVRLPERIAQVRARCVLRGEKQGLEPAFVDALYALLIEQTCLTEEKVMAGAEDSAS